MEVKIVLPKTVAQIINQLNAGGYEAFAVGGCVRDSMLQKRPKDWDITTSAKPEQVKALFGRTIDTGIQHGTVTIMRDRIGYEVTTYRVDGEYLDGRHPSEVMFTVDLLEDLKRRDFTINAMAYHHQTGLVDAFEGLEDLQKKQIRCVGNPLDRFGEDALRMLRAIRFSAQLGFQVHDDTFQAIKELSQNLSQVSKERIQSEITKILLSEHPEQIELVKKSGLGSYIAINFLNVFQQTLMINNKFPEDKSLRWAAFLYHLSIKSAAAVLQDLKMDRSTMDRVRLLMQWKEFVLQADRKAVRKVMSQMTEEEFEAMIQFRKCLISDSKERDQLNDIGTIAQSIRDTGECLYLKDLAVKGSDLIALGIRPGKEFGEILQRLLELVLEHPEYNRKEYLIGKIL